MKLHTVAAGLLVFITGVGCASRARPCDACGALPEGVRVRDVTVRSAQFGTAGTLVDVSPRVAELLKTEPRGFEARSDWMRVEDPVPGKSKVLIIRYAHEGHERTYVVTGQQRASYDLLVNASKGR